MSQAAQVASARTLTARSPATLSFDGDAVNWRRLGEFEHFFYTILDVDPATEAADFVLKFEPGERIFLHRHRALTMTTVLAGEHRLYEPDGAVKEVRPLGSYTIAPPSPDPHQEGGGADGAVVAYSTRGSADGVVFDVLGDNGATVGTLSVADLCALFELQGGRPGV